MNNEEKKVEENLSKKGEKEVEGKGKEFESANKEVGFITKRMPLKKWGESYIDRCITIYNIDYTTTEDELLAHFKKVDGFEKMYVLKDPAHPELRNRGRTRIIMGRLRNCIRLKKIRSIMRRYRNCESQQTVYFVGNRG